MKNPKSRSHDFELKILSAPGKRKDIERQELGEDVAGFIQLNKYAVFWLADGAPGPNIKSEIDCFAPRILARYMGKSFEEASNNIIKKSIDFETDVKLGEEIFSISKKILKKKLKKKLKDLLNYLEEKKEKLPRNVSKNCYLLQWSVSFLAALVDLSSLRGLLLAAGDCTAFLRQGDQHKFLSGGKIFVNWSAPIDEIERFRIEIVEQHDIRIEEIEEIALISDGAASITDIEEIVTKHKDIDMIEEFPKKTDDDKTFIIFRALAHK